MQAKNGYFEHLFEASWLVAALLTPLFLNPYSARIFEPDKAALLRSIALFLTALWLIDGLDLVLQSRKIHRVRQDPDRIPFQKPWHKQPLFWIALLVLGTNLLSTLTSVAPRISFLGSYQRLQGTYTLWAYCILFFTILMRLRTPEQFQRLLIAMILSSFPVALYGIIQHFQIDFLIFPKHVAQRCTSTAGNPIFLGGYLIMLIPLTLACLKPAWNRMTRGLESSEIIWGLLLALASSTVLLICICILALGDVFWLQVIGLWLFLTPLISLFVAIPKPSFVRVMTCAIPIFFSSLIFSLIILQTFFPFSDSTSLWVACILAGLFILIMMLFGHFTRQNTGVFLFVTALLLTLTAQIICLLFTQSRGPSLALFGSLSFFVVLRAITHKRLWICWSIAGLVFTVIAVVTAINILQQSAGSFPEHASFSRLTGLTQSRSIQVRRQIWQGVDELMSTRPEMSRPALHGPPTKDSRYLLRPYIGYGPETFQLVFPRVYPAKLGTYEGRKMPDRSHNKILDALIMTGGLGVAALLFMYTALFYLGFCWLGLCETNKQKFFFVSLLIGGEMLGFAIAWPSHHPYLVGLGPPGGLLFGLGAYIMFLLLRPSALTRKRSKNDPRDNLLLLALLSSLLAHFIEIQFGIETTVTGSYFWIYTALIACLGLRMREAFGHQVLQEGQSISKKTFLEFQPVLHDQSLLASLKSVRFIGPFITGTLLFAGLPALMQQFAPFPEARLALPHQGIVKWSGFVLLLGAFWIICSLLFHASRANIQAKTFQKISVLNLLKFQPFLTLLFLCVMTFLGLLIFISLFELWSLTFVCYAGFMFVMLGLIAYGLLRMDGGPGGQGLPCPLFGPFSFIAICLFGLALVGAYFTNLQPIQADINYKYAQELKKQGQLHHSIQILQTILNHSPHTTQYGSTLGQYYQKKGLDTEPQTERDEYFDKAENILRKVLRENPHLPQNWINLARLYHSRALSGKGIDQETSLQMAWNYFEQASELSQQNFFILNDWAFSLQMAGDFSRALTLYRQSIELNPDQGPILLRIGGIYLKNKNWRQASQTYQRAARLLPQAAEAFSGLGYALMQEQKTESAIAAYHKAIEAYPENYNDYKNLGIAYHKIGRPGEAALAFEKALQLAPEQFKAGLRLALEKAVVDKEKRGRPSKQGGKGR